ncbi:VWA domain-containing protein [Streptomyces sp. TRM66268-LWL]|uniref:VWA domain-containing protein n=1 Tax=Streptomyces polyasparticus TaxID=2767826 RepID=A0ABR7SV84_9ACTN|nr:VWA domain-containing protein [Streptomyces polyasparticus]MBC9718799.1 VWA domain-containing protein [Streptomyces polyasparticus]
MPIDFEKVPAGLVSLVKTAAVSLEKQGLTGRRAAVYLVLDRSGSMRRYYKDGSMQHLAEQALGLSANLDDDGIVPTVFFDTDAHAAVDISLDHYQGRITELHDALGHMGTTNYAAAMEAVIGHYLDSGVEAPAFVLFQTDGSPDSRRAAEKTLCKAAELPIFWQFIGYGDDEFGFLRKLDDLAVPKKRLVDNAGFFPAGKDPKLIPDGVLYDRLMGEFPDWLRAASAAGVLR